MSFQRRNPTTFISRVQIIYAVLCYFWIKRDPENQAEYDRDSKTAVPNVNLGPFIAYFGAYLKFHEIFRLGAYAHPFDLISEWYKRDCAYSSRFEVTGDEWERVFAMLEAKAVEPFAILVPSMLEGSSLGGPFLPQEHGWTLSDIQHRMGLGSIWTIGPPSFPSKPSRVGEGTTPIYDVYAYPEHWKDELPSNENPLLDASFFSEHPLQSLPNHHHSLPCVEHCFREAAGGIPARHIGFKLGAQNINNNHGWTSHLPGKGGLLCSQFGAHDVTKMNGNNTKILGLGTCEPDATNRVSFATHFSHKPTEGSSPTVEFGEPIALPEVSASMENKFLGSSEDGVRSLVIDIRQIVEGAQLAKKKLPLKSSTPTPKSHRTLRKEIKDLQGRLAKAQPAPADDSHKIIESMRTENDKLKAMVSALQADLNKTTQPPSRLFQGEDALPTQATLSTERLQEQLNQTNHTARELKAECESKDKKLKRQEEQLAKFLLGDA